MSMEAQVKKMCQTAYFHIRNINSIRRLLSHEAAATLVHAFITSRLDDGNSLLYGINDCLLKKLQLIQNTAARVLSKTRKYDHITPVLKKLHWLPVKQRIEYKILLLTWKSLNGISPAYLSDLITHYTPNRELRSSDKRLLYIPRTNTSSGDRAFSISAPCLWNSLPEIIRKANSLDTFKSLLKTHLFACAYKDK